jgi:LysM repeat protein
MLSQTHTVQPGEALSAIARRHGTTTRELARLNAIADPDRIHAGQVLRIAEPLNAEVRLGSLSERYETSGRGPGTVSGGHGDLGGVSYGSYQLATNLGRPQQFLLAEGAPYARHFAGMEPGTAAFSAAWRAVAAEHPDAFGKAQHSYILRTHYEVQRTLIRRTTGIDAALRSAALRDVIWSCAVQHGPSSSLVSRCIAALGIDPDAPDFDRELISAIYAERGRTNADGSLVHFARSSQAVQRGVAARFAAECADALAALSLETEGDAAFLQRISVRMTDADVDRLLARHADQWCRDRFAAGDKVLVALRRSTNWRTAERGRYDDPMMLIWRSGKAVAVRRLRGNTEAAGIYAAGAARADRGSTVDLDGDGRRDLARLPAGTYRFVPETSTAFGKCWRIAETAAVERDCDHDGRFNAGHPGSRDGIDPQGAGRTILIHKGSAAFTASAGCQTLPPADFAQLLRLAHGQSVLSYVLAELN